MDETTNETPTWDEITYEEQCFLNYHGWRIRKGGKPFVLMVHQDKAPDFGTVEILEDDGTQ